MTSVYNLIESGLLRAAQLRPHGSWRVSREDVEKLAARLEQDLGNGSAK